MSRNEIFLHIAGPVLATALAAWVFGGCKVRPVTVAPLPGITAAPQSASPVYFDKFQDGPVSCYIYKGTMACVIVPERPGK